MQPSLTATMTPAPLDCHAYGVADAGSAASQFFAFDPRTVTFADLGPLHVGADIEAIAIDPRTDEVYAAAGDDGVHDGMLYHVNHENGTLMPIGSTGFSTVDALAFRPTDSHLWGWASGRGLIQIDLATGVATLMHSATGGSSALAWSLDGLTLYGVSGTTLWSYNPSTTALTVLGTNFPATSLMLAVQPDGQLLSGIEDDQTLKLVRYDPTRHQVTAHARIAEPYDDLEALAWPGACADQLFTGIPTLKSGGDDRGAPNSYFALQAAGFSSAISIVVTVNDVAVGVLSADAQGQLPLALFFNAHTPPGTYIIATQAHPRANRAGTSINWSAESLLTVDPVAPRLINHGTAPVINGTLSTYLPSILGASTAR